MWVIPNSPKYGVEWGVVAIESSVRKYCLKDNVRLSKLMLSFLSLLLVCHLVNIYLQAYTITDCLTLRHRKRDRVGPIGWRNSMPTIKSARGPLYLQK